MGQLRTPRLASWSSPGLRTTTISFVLAAATTASGRLHDQEGSCRIAFDASCGVLPWPASRWQAAHWQPVRIFVTHLRCTARLEVATGPAGPRHRHTALAIAGKSDLLGSKDKARHSVASAMRVGVRLKLL